MKKSTKTLINLSFIALLFVALFCTEKFGSSDMLLLVLKKGCIYALIAASMNLLNGFTGLFSLGQAGFMLIGAYTYAICTVPTELRETVYLYFDGGLIKTSLQDAVGGLLPFLPEGVSTTLAMIIAMIFGGLIAAGFAYLIGLPVLRLKSDYLAIATLGFAEIIRAVAQWDTLGVITNGSNLLKKYPKFTSIMPYFIIVGICIAIIVLLINSTYGRAFKAIRDDEIAAEAMGINLAHHKQLSFVISSFFAGVGGAMLAMYQTTVQANAFKSAMTYEILLIVVIGGIGSISGSVIASFLYIACSEWWLRFLDTETAIGTFKLPFFRAGFRMVVFSVIIMIVVLFFRRGIMGDKELSINTFLPKSKKRSPENAIKEDR